MKFHKYINDNVYGSIPVTKIESQLINTLAFQSLRYIKQLGLAHLVFPSADHSRFSHSLGVMHVAGRMAERLRELGVLADKAVRTIRIAGLLHDIGHYPLSHLGETVYKHDKPRGIKVLREDSKLEPGSNLEPGLLMSFVGSTKNEEANHENLGGYVISNRDEIRIILEDNDFDPEGLVV